MANPYGPPGGPPRRGYPRGRRAFNFNFHGFGMGHPGSAYIRSLRAAVMRVGLALVGGDMTGATRGNWALDLQNGRTSTNQVASGRRAVALGNENEASATGATAIGLTCTANGINALAIGKAAWGGADDGIAIGSNAFVGGLQAIALGFNSNARVDKTSVISGPICGQVGNVAGAADWFQQLAGAAVIIRMGWIDAMAVADNIMTLPAGCRFWVDELGVIVSSLAGVTAQPAIHFGISGTPQKYVANFVTTYLTAVGHRQLFNGAVSGDGEQTLLFGIATAATGAGMKVSPYWRGVLMESS